jgi:hypothetical protein
LTHHLDLDPDSDFYLMRIWMWMWIFLNADADPTFHPNADPDLDPSFQIKAQTLESAQIGSYFTHFGLPSAIKEDLVPNPAHHLMQIRILIFI